MGRSYGVTGLSSAVGVLKDKVRMLVCVEGKRGKFCASGVLKDKRQRIEVRLFGGERERERHCTGGSYEVTGISKAVGVLNENGESVEMRL